MLELTVKIREKTGRKVKSLRQKGIVPAVLYRKGKDNVNLQLDRSDFRKIFREAGESTVIKLTISGDSDKVKNKERNVLIHDISREPLTGQVIHIDFYEVRMDEKTTASVPLVFIGESQAVKTGGGTLIKNINEVQVEALVRDLPRQIEVDITKLATFDEIIYIKDLKISASVKVLAKPDDIVALASPPRKEEEVAAPVAPAEGTEEVKAEGGAEETEVKKES